MNQEDDHCYEPFIFTRHQPNRFVEYKAINKHSFIIIGQHQDQIIYHQDQDFGWIDESGCYYNAKGLPQGWIVLSKNQKYFKQFTMSQKFLGEKENKFYKIDKVVCKQDKKQSTNDKQDKKQKEKKQKKSKSETNEQVNSEKQNEQLNQKQQEVATDNIQSENVITQEQAKNNEIKQDENEQTLQQSDKQDIEQKVEQKDNQQQQKKDKSQFKKQNVKSEKQNQQKFDNQGKEDNKFYLLKLHQLDDKITQQDVLDYIKQLINQDAEMRDGYVKLKGLDNSLKLAFRSQNDNKILSKFKFVF